MVRARATLMALLVALIVALGCGLVVARSVTVGESQLDGYPQRIGFDRPSDRLPSRPGVLAATLYDNDFGNGRQLGVTSSGHLWELPLGTTALSPDGRLLLTVTETESGVGSHLQVRDLVGGTRKGFPDITDSVERDDRAVRYHLNSYGQIYWSPDSGKVVAEFGESPRRHAFRSRVLDVRTGTLESVGRGQPAGFRTPSKAVTVRKIGGASAAGGIVMTTSDLSTGHRSHVALRLTSPWVGDRDQNLTANLSPDGDTLLLIEIPKGTPETGRLRLFSTSDGVEEAPRSIDHLDIGHNCPPEWLRGDPVLPAKRQAAGAVLVTATNTKPLVAVHYRMQSSCLHVVADALNAGPNRALFGTSTSWWTWYWKPFMVLSLLLLMSLAYWGWRRRYGARTPS